MATSGQLFQRFDEVRPELAAINNKIIRGEPVYQDTLRTAKKLGWNVSTQGRKGDLMRQFITDELLNLSRTGRDLRKEELLQERNEQVWQNLGLTLPEFDDAEKVDMLNRNARRAMEFEEEDLAEIPGDMLTSESKFSGAQQEVLNQLGLPNMTVNLQVDSLGDAYYLLLFAKQYAQANNVDININVKQGRENYRNAKSGTPLANTQISGRESPEEIKRKAENIIFSITRLYKDATGNIEAFDNRDSYRFRFLKTPRTQPEDVPMTAFHRGKIAIPVFKNCVVAAIARKLHGAYQGKNRKILIALDEKVRENGFNTKDAKKYLEHLPADFYFVSPDGPFLEVINRHKYSSKRHDIKKIVIMVELGHAKLYEPSIKKAKKEHIIGDSIKILDFANDYGLPVSGDIQQPFIVSERSNVIFKSYKPEYDPKSLNRVQDIKNKFFSTSKTDLNVYDPLIDYYRHSRKYICYRDADLNRDEYVKVDINGAYHTAMMQVKFPAPGAESYKLIEPMSESEKIKEMMNDFTINEIEGLFYCEYKTEWPGHLDKLRQHENDWISIDMAKRLANKYDIYPDSISHIIFNRRILDVSNFDSDWLNELRYAKKSSKKDFNSLVGSLCPSRVTKQRFFQHQDDLNMFLAQANIKKYNIYDWRKTGRVTTSVCVDNGKTNWKSVWNGAEEVERANVEEFEDIEIIYSDPNDKRTGLPSLQAAIVNHVSFVICETANRIEKETGKKVYSIWTDSIAYKKEYIDESSSDICILCDGEGYDPVDCEECLACNGTGEITQSIRYEDKNKRLDLEQLKEWSGFTWKDEEFKKVFTRKLIVLSDTVLLHVLLKMSTSTSNQKKNS